MLFIPGTSNMESGCFFPDLTGSVATEDTTVLILVTMSTLCMLQGK